MALNIHSNDTSLEWMFPAWKRWGTAKTLKPQSVIRNSRKDNVISMESPEELVAPSQMSSETLMEVGSDQRQAE